LDHLPLGSRFSSALDLGCGSYPRNPFSASIAKGVDILSPPEHKNVLTADLFHEPIPFDDASFDVVTAFDFIEHVPRVLSAGSRTRLPFVELMNEIHRVLGSGGFFFSRTPAFPSRHAFGHLEKSAINKFSAGIKKSSKAA
jgi:SAM-dependent methyltransferase